MSKIRFLQKVKLHEKALCKSKGARNRNSQRSKMKMLLLTRKEKKPYNNQKVCWVCKEELNEKINENESYCKLPVL